MGVLCTGASFVDLTFPSSAAFFLVLDVEPLLVADFSRRVVSKFILQIPEHFELNLPPKPRSQKFASPPPSPLSSPYPYAFKRSVLLMGLVVVVQLTLLVGFFNATPKF